MCTTETVRQNGGETPGGAPGANIDEVEGLIHDIVGGGSNKRTVVDDVAHENVGGKRGAPEELVGNVGEIKRARGDERRVVQEEVVEELTGDDDDVQVDPLSNDFPSLDEAQGYEDVGKEGVVQGKDGKYKEGGGEVGLPNPFDLGDEDLSFPDLDVVEGSTESLLQGDPDDSMEIIGETILPRKGDSRKEAMVEDGQNNNGAAPDFSTALKEIEDDVYEDDVIDLSSDDEEANPTMRIKSKIAPNPSAAISSTTIDLTDDNTQQTFSQYQNNYYGQQQSGAYGQQPNPYAQYNPYAQPNPYQQSNPYAQANSYAQQGNAYAQSGNLYAQTNAYAQAYPQGYNPYQVQYTPYMRNYSVSDRPMTKESLEGLLKKNNLTADATEELPTPKQLLVELMPHQRRALKWMKKRETMDASVRGGILADDQGLGKTLSTIAMMITVIPRRIPLDEEGFADPDYESICYDIPAEKEGEFGRDGDGEGNSGANEESGRSYSESENNEDGEDRRTMRAPWRTLIVCPVSLVHQWKEELLKHISDPKPDIYIYHGKTKTQDLDVLQSYDVVITTYSTLAMQYPKVNKKDPQYDACKEAKAELPTRPAGAMYKMTWFRIVLDEAQYIKNRYTENFQAVHHLKAYRRWCLTGTPIQNSVDDLYSQFMFIRYMIVPNYKEWQRVWKKKLESPYEMTRDRAFKRFQALVGVVLLRRTKLDRIDDKPLISLPDRTVELKELDFVDPDEASFYQSVQVKSIVAVNKYLANGTINNNYSSILLLLLRLRQAATHPHLTKSSQRAYDLSGALHDPSKQVVWEQLKMRFGERVVQVFTSGTPPVCSECQSNAESWNSVVLGCGHVFCCECTPDPFITCTDCQAPVGNAKCTLEDAYMEMTKCLNAVQGQAGAAKEENMEVQKVKEESVVVDGTSGEQRGTDMDIVKSEDVLPKEELKVDGDSVDGETKPVKNEEGELIKRPSRMPASSTKLETLLQELHGVKQKDPEEKSLVFSQWTSMLDIIEAALKERGFSTCRLDGSMAMNSRRDAIERFKTCQKHTVMLISLHAGGTGLNLTVARNVFLMDVWWNPAVEEQAIDRAHRIGQKSNVRVIRMKIKGTVEERIYDLCAKKRELMEGALGAKGSQSLGRKKLSMKDLLYLFGGAAEDVLNTNGADVGQIQSSEAAQAAANILKYAKDGAE